MKILVRALLSLLVMLATLFLANCSPYGCRVTFGSSACSSSGTGISTGGGTGGGGGGGGGTGVDASAAAALVYYDTSAINAAGYTTANVLGTLNSYTPPTLPGNGADDMLIVNKTFLYVPMGNATVEGFAIDRTSGALTAITGSPWTVAGTSVTADDVASDAAGKFLFVGSETGPNIWVFQIDATSGALTATAGSPFSAGLTVVADEMTVDLSGKYLYVGQTDPTAGVGAFSIDPSTGALTPLSGSPFLAAQVAQIHASPTAELLFGVQEVADGTIGATDKNIYTYVINPITGALTEVGAGTVTLAAPFDFAISPNGGYLYAVEASASLDAPIEGFAINTSTGTLASLGTFSGVPTAEGCRFDQSGLYLFCINTLFGTTVTVNIASPTTGALTHGADLSVTTNSPFAVTD
jgi:6-phosphogluconolactonase (cycloisomerase 2 family)